MAWTSPVALPVGAQFYLFLIHGWGWSTRSNVLKKKGEIGKEKKEREGKRKKERIREKGRGRDRQRGIT